MGVSSNNATSIEDLFSGLDQVGQGVTTLGKRVAANDQKLRILQENHGESVRYLREYRDNFRSISSEFAQLAAAAVRGGGL